MSFDPLHFYDYQAIQRCNNKETEEEHYCNAFTIPYCETETKFVYKSVRDRDMVRGAGVAREAPAPGCQKLEVMLDISDWLLRCPLVL